jgi:small-conductance mechanosensitive channel
MKKSDWQYLVDTLLFICIVGIAFIGFLMGLVIPKGPQASESAKYFLGLHRHQWGNIHFYLSLALVVFIIIHLVLSWSWIKGKARQLFLRGWKTMLILTAALSLLVLFLFWALYPRTPGAYEDYGVGRRAKAEASEGNLYSHEERIFLREGQEEIVITGQMTLLDIESKTGISARSIADELNLPSGISFNETLGRLRRQHHFTMQEVRDAVGSLMKEKNKEEKSDKHK